MSDLAYWPSAKPLSKNDKFAKNRDYIENLNPVSYTQLRAHETLENLG